MDSNIKNTRHLLLLFPDDVARNLPALGTIGTEMTK